jgi:hypothetical protein
MYKVVASILLAHLKGNNYNSRVVKKSFKKCITASMKYYTMWKLIDKFANEEII